MTSGVVARYGVYGQEFQAAAGNTVATLRHNLTPAWNIPADALAFSGRRLLDESYILQPGEHVEFHRPDPNMTLPPPLTNAPVLEPPPSPQEMADARADLVRVEKLLTEEAQ